MSNVMAMIYLNNFPDVQSLGDCFVAINLSTKERRAKRSIFVISCVNIQNEYVLGT